ncbi:MAG: DUF4010 domain-containing protein [Bacteroidota bacterium]|nr:DUF4010 domain-containing protein [Bacteroidota bacterium]
MFQSILNYIPIDLQIFLLVLIFALLIGLEQRRHHINEPFEQLFGTDRTFTLLGILGYILYVIDKQQLFIFIIGAFFITVLLSIYYFQKISKEKKFGLTSIVIALITYTLAPLIYTQPLWLTFCIVIVILVITEAKKNLFAFSKLFNEDEFIVLAKFLVLTGVILPLLPTKPISMVIAVSPYQIWLAVVVISSISYASYLVKKFIFPNAGILITAVLGGLYSSTATTVILARKSKENPSDSQILPGMLLATLMMYIRLFIIAFIFNSPIAFALLPYFIFFVLITAGIIIALQWMNRNEAKQLYASTLNSNGNPLEFKTAIIFATLFIVFSLLTTYVFHAFGNKGLNVLALVVGVTDIDPFILNLFQGKIEIDKGVIVLSVLNAIISNNVLKMIYAISLETPQIRKKTSISFAILIAAGIGISLWLYLIKGN